MTHVKYVETFGSQNYEMFSEWPMVSQIYAFDFCSWRQADIKH